MNDEEKQKIRKQVRLFRERADWRKRKMAGKIDIGKDPSGMKR